MRSSMFRNLAIVVSVVAVQVLFFFAVNGHAYTTTDSQIYTATTNTRTASPIDDAWHLAVTDSVSATTNPYRPNAATGTTSLLMSGYTGLTICAQYTSSATVTAPVCYVWGWKGDSWCALKTTAGVYAITLTPAATDSEDAVQSLKWTAPSDPIDAIGCSKVLVTVGTAATATAGTVPVLISRM